MAHSFHPPPSVIASWPHPNYIDPENEGPGLVVVGVMLTILGTSIVCTRVYARVFITQAFGIDDVLIILATITAIVLTSLSIVSNVRYYAGYHVWDCPTWVFIPHRINTWVAVIFSALTMSFTKISILFFYRRLSGFFPRPFLIAVWVGIVYNAIYCIVFILEGFLLCRPFQAYWLQFDSSWTAKHSWSCGSETDYEVLLAAFSTLGDLYTTLVPLVLIFNLEMPRRQKQSLYFLFGLGFLVIVVGIFRAFYVYTALNLTYDFTWVIWKIWMSANVEVWMAICVASAPALKPVVKKFSTVLGQRLPFPSEGQSQKRKSRQKNVVTTTNTSTKGSRMSVPVHDGYHSPGDGTAKDQEGMMWSELEMGNMMAVMNGNVTASDYSFTNYFDNAQIIELEHAQDLQDTHDTQDTPSESGQAQVKGKWWSGRNYKPWSKRGNSKSPSPC